MCNGFAAFSQVCLVSGGSHIFSWVSITEVLPPPPPPPPSPFVLVQILLGGVFSPEFIECQSLQFVTSFCEAISAAHGITSPIKLLLDCTQNDQVRSSQPTPPAAAARVHENPMALSFFSFSFFFGSHRSCGLWNTVPHHCFRLMTVYWSRDSQTWLSGSSVSGRHKLRMGPLLDSPSSRATTSSTELPRSAPHYPEPNHFNTTPHRMFENFGFPPPKLGQRLVSAVRD